MARFWFKRINGDIQRIDEVPVLWREKVMEMIEQTQASV